MGKHTDYPHFIQTTERLTSSQKDISDTRLHQFPMKLSLFQERNPGAARTTIRPLDSWRRQIELVLRVVARFPPELGLITLVL
jgi:hypothetical protein